MPAPYYERITRLYKICVLQSCSVPLQGFEYLCHTPYYTRMYVPYSSQIDVGITSAGAIFFENGTNTYLFRGHRKILQLKSNHYLSTITTWWQNCHIVRGSKLVYNDWLGYKYIKIDWFYMFYLFYPFYRVFSQNYPIF